jgi:hypothetical protein
MTTVIDRRALRPAGPGTRTGAAAHAAKPSRADARRVTPQACVQHDAPEGREGEAGVQRQ